MQTLIDTQQGRLQAAAVGLAVLRRAGSQGGVRARRRRRSSPYFELDRVLQDGVFFAAHQLYGLTFKERHDIPVYHPDVRVFEVFDADGKSLGALLRRLLQARQQGGGAWMDTFVDQTGLLDDAAGRVQRLQLHQARRRASPRC